MTDQMNQSHPTLFPGCIYDPDGKRLDRNGPDMTQEQLDDHLHQTLLAAGEGAEVSRVWLLADDAQAITVPPAIMAEAIRTMLAGQGILIAARTPEAELDVRLGLLRALDLVVARQVVPADGPQ